MITLITGGIKSGKSDFTLDLAEKSLKKENFYFLATAVPLDKEMQERIKAHRKKRKNIWETIEESVSIDSVIESLPENSTVLIDWISFCSYLIKNYKNNSLNFQDIKGKVKSLILSIKEKDIRAFLITNEVGSGIIPGDEVSRSYEDFLGMTNQMIARYADEVYLMVAGVGVKIKPATTA